MAKIKETLRPLGTQNSWARTHGTYLGGQAAIDGADAVAIQMEQKWGAGRLRLLVPTELRERFDRQRYLLNAAIWHGDLEQVRQEASRMCSAWRRLDYYASQINAPPLSPVVWELALTDGTTVALVRSHEDAHAVAQEGRQLVIYTLEELATMLERYQEVTRVKEVFPGSKVTAIRQNIPDPLDRIRDGASLDDPMDDEIPELG